LGEQFPAAALTSTRAPSERPETAAKDGTIAPDFYERVEALFAVGVDLHRSQWDEFLTRACPDDPALRAEGKSLLENRIPFDTLSELSAEENQVPSSLIAPVTQRFRCPHCHNPVQLADDHPDEVLCPACGSGFRVREARETVSATPMRPLGKFQLLERI